MVQQHLWIPIVVYMTASKLIMLEGTEGAEMSDDGSA
jgi:hypothetical protein